MIKRFLNIVLFPFRCILRFIDMEGYTYCAKPPKEEGLKNPYELVWYRHGWSENRIKKNNTKYWQWEIEHNGFIPANSTKNNLKKVPSVK